jgi:hypothetical protein
MPAKKRRASQHTAPAPRPEVNLKDLYPAGHQPFIPRGVHIDPLIADFLAQIPQETSLVWCLNSAYLRLVNIRLLCEDLRAYLFRAEHLPPQTLEPRDLFIWLPHDVHAVLESLNAARQCLEEWLESDVCHAILRRYPERWRPRSA